PQAPLDLDGEVDVPGRVDDVDPVLAPEAGGRGGGDGDAALLLLLHPVHLGGPLVDLAHLPRDARIEEDPLGGRGLPRVDVRHDPDVPDLRYGRCPSHDCRVAFPTLSRFPSTGTIHVARRRNPSGPPLCQRVKELKVPRNLGENREITSGNARTPCWRPPSC